MTALQGTSLAPYSDNSIVRWAYDENLNLTEVETAGGAVHQYQNYDNQGNPGTLIFAYSTPEQRTLTFTYHPQMNVTLSRTEASVLGGGNKETIWDYDNDYNLVPNENPTKLLSQIFERGFTKDGTGTVVSYEYITSFTYNTNGQLLSVDGPLAGIGDTTAFSYESVSGDLLSVTQPIIGSTQFSNYNAAGYVGQVTNVSGQIESFVYDGRGRVTTVTHLADGSTSSLTYSTAGMIANTTDEDSITRTNEYDPVYGRLAKIIDPDNNYIGYIYDTQGNRIETGKYDPTDTRTSRKRWSYEHPNYPGMLWKEIKADDSYKEYGYDANGNVVLVADFESNTTTYSYDPLNRLKTVTQPGNIVTNYGYDNHGNLILVTDANNHSTTYEFDDMSRTLTATSLDAGTTSYTYDAAGNMVNKTDANGITATYTYDFLNRVTAATFPDPVDNMSYTYDEGITGTGRLTGLTDPSGSTAFSYDNRGRLVGKASTVSGTSYPLSRTFTPGGRLSSFTYPSGRSIDYTRYTTGRVQEVATTYNTNTVALVSNLSYNPFGGPKGMDNGAGGSISNVSEECDCLTISNPGEPMEKTYAYDLNGNLNTVRGTNAIWYNKDYTYDELNRLTLADDYNGTISYTYDNVGNRLTRTVGFHTQEYFFNSGTNLLNRTEDLDPVRFTYDPNGNAVSMGLKSLIYNQNNRLIKIEDGVDIIAEYSYNALGQRTTKQVDGVTTVFLYDFDGKIIGESLPDGSFNYEYLYLWSNRMAMVDFSDGSLYYYQNDHLGTPILITDATNTIVWEANYKPFGEAEVDPESIIENNFRFAGQYFDAETELHYNYHRYYDPSIGRYLRPDPIGLQSGINLFAYAQNNPTNMVDPFGLEVFDPNNLLNTGFNSRSPDYYSFTLNVTIKNPKTDKYMGWVLVFEKDRYGRFYRSLAGVGGAIGRFPVSASFVAGWIDDECGMPSRDKLEEFLKGPSINVSAGWGLGGGYTFVPNKSKEWQRGFELGIYVTPQVGVGSAYSYQVK